MSNVVVTIHIHGKSSNPRLLASAVKQPTTWTSSVTGWLLWWTCSTTPTLWIYLWKYVRLLEGKITKQDHVPGIRLGPAHETGGDGRTRSDDHQERQRDERPRRMEHGEMVSIKHRWETRNYMMVSLNRGTPKSSIFIGFSLINHLFWGETAILVFKHLKTGNVTPLKFTPRR